MNPYETISQYTLDLIPPSLVGTLGRIIGLLKMTFLNTSKNMN